MTNEQLAALLLAIYPSLNDVSDAIMTLDEVSTPGSDASKIANYAYKELEPVRSAIGAMYIELTGEQIINRAARFCSFDIYNPLEEGSDE